MITILEQGKAICMLHHLLEKYYEKYLENNVLKKCVIDIAAGAEKVFTVYKTAVCVFYL
jgi:hypothetical protein